ncbi:hypothetical protein A1O3_03130 [Capronia epimyces CBS 606.96]|uniref:Cupin 2 conserved barrel domain-containing protein n=1 Tax=Capronia epimyces CBS 606.96 TaxID=1182542 RepID=W9YB25_9EURO|nr:uncharacterized protein A1O3_03130 [Capronia epimyces CBS 606.96]EXJ90062.1 hypothetical protein A1O3_03130 [Capronia epimyces CBS 606.96]
MPVERQHSSQIRIFRRGGPQTVTYDLSKPAHVTITVPVSSTWTSGLHWHETHTEYLQILQGRAFVRVGDRSGHYGAEDRVIEVPKYTVHEWHRIDENEDEDDGAEEDLIVREWTAPEDGQKEAFFRMLNSFLTEDHPSSLYEMSTLAPTWLRRVLEGWIVTLQLLSIFRAWDNWPVLVGNNGGWVSWSVTHAVLYVCYWIGRVLGLRGVYIEYVGRELAVRVGVKQKEM